MNEKVTVLIVGGGMAGLSSAAFLAAHGVACVLVERHEDLLIHPRARGVTARTVELFRQLGVEDRILAARNFDADLTRLLMIRAATLASADFAIVEPDPLNTFAGVSPCEWAPIDQDKLEIITRDRARELGADIRFATELTHWRQDADGVSATIRDLATGTETAVRADYLIAADGWASPIREQAGIAMHGPGVLAHTAIMVFNADLSPAMGDREIGFAYLTTPRPGTVVLRVGADRWTLATSLRPEHGERVEDLTERRCVELVRAAVGLPDVAVKLVSQIPGRDATVLDFTISAALAHRYREGPVFLVGDAAHAMPPTGGFGGSTGIQDAHNLAWKIAAVIRGQAGPALLDTYEAERRPVGELTIGQALARARARFAGGGPKSPVDLIEAGALTFGYRYRSSAVLGAAEDTAPVSATELHGEPGTRAPHLRVLRDGVPVSTLDLYGTDFVLLTGPDATGWERAGRQVAATCRPVTVLRIGTDLTEDGDPVTTSMGTGAAGAVLVRPDGFVAWRTGEGHPEPEAELRAVLARVLG